MGSTELHGSARPDGPPVTSAAGAPASAAARAGETTHQDVAEFWEASSCGEVYAEGASPIERLEAQRRARYALEPYIRDFARFQEGPGRRVLEVGVGMGADHFEWASHEPTLLVGMDLTSRALDHTRTRFSIAGRRPRLLQGDAERLPFPDAAFDIVYSWGVLHHTPGTPAAIREIHRVLKPGGVARVMIYHRRSIVGLLLWARYGLLAGRPLRSLDDIYARHLESPGTKAYTLQQGRDLFQQFDRVHVTSRLSFADLLEGAAGNRHGGGGMALLRRWWPRWLITRAAPRSGLYLMIEAQKRM